MLDVDAVIGWGREVIQIEARALTNISKDIDASFACAVGLALNSCGRVIVSGVGKSGLVGKKISATLASTGTPSFFMHPSEAFHGDLGMVTSEDVLLAISNSGETDELLKLVPFLKHNGNKLISISGSSSSSLAVNSDVSIEVAVDAEACALDLAPTASTTAVMAVGDALAVALMRMNDFSQEDFARFHPGGSLGRRLLAKVGDYTRTSDIPTVPASASFEVVLDEVMRGGLGVSLVEAFENKGVVTDGDIRRAISNNKKNVFSLTAADFWTENPVKVKSTDMLYEAEKLFLELKITCLVVEFPDGRFGILKQEFLQ